MRRLVERQYERNDLDFHRGTFRVRGDTVEVFPAYEEERAVRIELLRRRGGEDHRVRPAARRDAGRAGEGRHLPREPLRHRAGHRARARSRPSATSCPSGSSEFKREGKLLEAQRLEQRTMFDLEMIEQMGFCNGIENYSRHFSGRRARRAAAVPARLLPAQHAGAHRREPPDDSADRRHVPRRPLAQGDAGGATASACPAPSTTGRSSSTSSRTWCSRPSSSPRPPPSTSCRSPRAWWWSRSSAPRA